MKNKKYLPAIILAAAVFLMVVFSVINNIAVKPKITEGEFPFSITYEVDGERITVKDVYKVRYNGNAGYADTKSRTYVGELASSGEGDIAYVIKEDGDIRVELWTYLYSDYLMGDTKYDYFDDKEFAPQIYCFDGDGSEYYDEETVASYGVKLISFDYPTPIKNSFTFSHLSYSSSVVVLPTILIALLALIVTFIFVKKEKEHTYKIIDVFSIFLNFIIGIGFQLFVTALAMLIDMEGGGPELYYQIIYFVPAFSLLCVTASVALRRKGHRVKSLLVEFGGPVVFAVYLIVFYAGGLM